MKTGRLRGALPALAATVFCLPLAWFVWTDGLRAGLWCDEAGSLIKFVLVPVWRTLSYYPEPNNHIFANLIGNLYLRLIGQTDLFAVEAAPMALRLLYLAFTAWAVASVFRLARMWWDDLAAILAVAVFATCLPILHFAAQVRGYPVSLGLAAAAMLACARHESLGRSRDALAAVLYSCLLVYTIPYNLFFAVGLCGWYLVAGLFAKAPGRRGSRPARRVAAAVACGTVLGAALYLPVLSQLLNNPYAKAGRLLNWQVLTVLLPEVLGHFLSGRIMLLPLLAGGLLAVTLHPKFRERPQYPARTAMLAAVFFVPLLLTFVRGVAPYDRLFLVLLPAFALACGSWLSALARLLGEDRRWLAIYGAVVCTYCMVIFSLQANAVPERLADDIRQGELTQNLSLGYYQSWYHPVKTLNEIQGAPGFNGCVYQHGQAVLGMDLAARHIVERGAKSANEIYFDEHGRAVVVSTDPGSLAAQIGRVYENASCRRVSSEFSFHTVLACECKTPCRKRHVALDQNPRLIDLGNLRQTLERYRADHGAYPATQGFNGLHTLWGAAGPDWIPGLAPAYIDALPRDPRLNDDPANQYLYASNGTDYKLLAHHPDDCPDVLQEQPSLIDPVRGCLAYGYWTAGAKDW